MTREQLIEQILELPREIVGIEPDCTSLCQAYWIQYLDLYEVIQEGKAKKIREGFLEGPWTDEDLSKHLRELSRAWSFSQD